MTIVQRVLEFLSENGEKPMSATEINSKCHTTEARKAIADLRRLGYDIRDMWESYEDESGKHRYKKYYLVHWG